jgi:uncharacterized membrane protein/nitrite reductase/ring-hydroxylating ferredoxin subunit
MRSRASISSHPIHPALIPFPFAFLVGAFLFDLLALLFDKPGFRTTAGYLAIAGVIAALIAAIPGAIDYFTTVPPKSSGKERATKHALVNLSAVALFFVAYLIRDTAGTTVVLLLEAIGTGLLGTGGYLGGTLVYRNQIGVDPRYASAGKWNEERFSAEQGKPVEVAKVDELKVDQMKLLHIDGRRIVLGRTEQGYVASDDHCTHRGGSLAGGAMICGTVQCPWHGSQFDVQTGKVKAGPAKKEIATYRVEEAGGKVRLTL